MSATEIRTLKMFCGFACLMGIIKCSSIHKCLGPFALQAMPNHVVQLPIFHVDVRTGRPAELGKLISSSHLGMWYYLSNSFVCEAVVQKRARRHKAIPDMIKI